MPIDNTEMRNRMLRELMGSYGQSLVRAWAGLASANGGAGGASNADGTTASTGTTTASTGTTTGTTRTGRDWVVEATEELYSNSNQRVTSLYDEYVVTRPLVTNWLGGGRDYTPDCDETHPYWVYTRDLQPPPPPAPVAVQTGRRRTSDEQSSVRIHWQGRLTASEVNQLNHHVRERGTVLRVGDHVYVEVPMTPIRSAPGASTRFETRRYTGLVVADDNPVTHASQPTNLQGDNQMTIRIGALGNFNGGVAYTRPGFVFEVARESASAPITRVRHVGTGRAYTIDQGASHHRGRTNDDIVSFCIGRIMYQISGDQLAPFGDDFEGYTPLRDRSYPPIMPTLPESAGVPQEGNNFSRLLRTNITGRILNRIGYQRTIQRGQLAWVNVERHGGTTTVPKYGCFVIIKNVYDNHCDVVYAGRGNAGLSTLNAYLGVVFSCAKSALVRVDLHATQDVVMDSRLSYWINWMNSDTNSAERLLMALVGGNRTNLTQRIASWTAHLNELRMVKWAARYAGLGTDRTRFFSGIKASLKNVGKRHGERTRMVEAVDSAEKAAAAYNALQDAFNNVSNRFRISSDRERELIRVLQGSLKDNFPLQFAGCGHAVQEGGVTSIEDWGTYCPTCLEAQIRINGPLVEALRRDGSVGRVFRRNVYTWDDGSVRTYEQPPVIGGYHSNKQTFTKSLPHVTGKMPHKSVLKVGYELEFCRDKPKHDDEWYARKMHERINAALTPVIGTQPYCGFERDGSVDFEMVSGYGPIDIHRAGVVALLQGNPFGSELQSHNGGRCGLHVHLDKPKSLMHATRLAAFYNNPFNEKLIRAVARRYGKNSGYAKFKPQVGDMSVSAKRVKENKAYYGGSNKEAVSRAITSLSQERYDVCNFTNARTVEIRAFRGSMLVDTVIACLEFAYMSWYFARDTEADRLTTDNFLKFISDVKWRHETRYLRKYLNGRGFCVWMPKRANKLLEKEV